jgi:hypothetical protein
MKKLMKSNFTTTLLALTVALTLVCVITAAPLNPANNPSSNTAIAAVQANVNTTNNPIIAEVNTAATAAPQANLSITGANPATPRTDVPEATARNAVNTAATKVAANGANVASANAG